MAKSFTPVQFNSNVNISFIIFAQTWKVVEPSMIWSSWQYLFNGEFLISKKWSTTIEPFLQSNFRVQSRQSSSVYQVHKRTRAAIIITLFSFPGLLIGKAYPTTRERPMPNSQTDWENSLVLRLNPVEEKCINTLLNRCGNHINK